MSDEPVSPAVKSLLVEQADQLQSHKTRLEKGLEDTFPASDPVSVTHTATAKGTSELAYSPEPEPLGLHASNTGRERDETEFHRTELRALQNDVTTLREKIHAVRQGGAGAATFDRHPLVTITLLAGALLILGAGLGTRRHYGRSAI